MPSARNTIRTSFSKTSTLWMIDLHFCSEAVVAVIDRQRLSPFLAQIAATVAEVSPDAATEDEFLLYGYTPP